MTRSELTVAPSDPRSADTADEAARLGHRPPPPAWLTALLLAAGTAVLVGSEFVPAGVLPLMAADFSVTEGQAGLAVAATAFAGMLTAPTMSSIVPRTDRRTVLLILLALATVSNALVTLSPSFGVMLMGRLLLGVAIAGYWSFTFGVGVQLTGRPALVSTSLAFGTSLATIIGVPLASLLGDRLGWRAVFGVVTLITMLVTALLAVVLPPVPAHPGAGFAMMRRAVANPRLMVGVAAVALVAFGNFTAYPFIRVAIEAVDPAWVTVLLLAWGVGGLAGTLAAGFLSRWLRFAVSAGPALLAVALAVVATSASSGWLAVAIVLWGIGFNMVPVTTQLWVSTIEPQRVEAAVSLQVTAFQTAITIGAVVGGALVDQRGVSAAVVTGALAAALAAVVFAAVAVRPRED